MTFNRASDLYSSRLCRSGDGPSSFFCRYGISNRSQPSPFKLTILESESYLRIAHSQTQRGYLSSFQGLSSRNRPLFPKRHVVHAAIQETSCQRRLRHRDQPRSIEETAGKRSPNVTHFRRDRQICPGLPRSGDPRRQQETRVHAISNLISVRIEATAIFGTAKPAHCDKISHWHPIARTTVTGGFRIVSNRD